MSLISKDKLFEYPTFSLKEHMYSEIKRSCYQFLFFLVLHLSCLFPSFLLLLLFSLVLLTCLRERPSERDYCWNSSTTPSEKEREEEMKERTPIDFSLSLLLSLSSSILLISCRQVYSIFCQPMLKNILFKLVNQLSVNKNTHEIRVRTIYV